MNNGAASPFAQFPAFGNNRSGGHGLYTGGIGIIVDNSAFDARPFSLTGQDTPKPAYNRLTGMAALGGPLKIPHMLPNGPNVFCRLSMDAKPERHDRTRTDANGGGTRRKFVTIGGPYRRPHHGSAFSR